MKNTILKSFIIPLLVATMMGCKSDSVTPETSAANALTGSWNTSDGYVKVDGTDVTSDYDTFKITFSTTSSGEHIYTIKNGGHAFEGITIDQWNFVGNTFTQINRGKDDVLLSYSIKDQYLTLNFTITDPVSEGRMSGLFGAFEMKLKKM